jgi:hypothetical protein
MDYAKLCEAKKQGRRTQEPRKKKRHDFERKIQQSANALLRSYYREIGRMDLVKTIPLYKEY